MKGRQWKLEGQHVFPLFPPTRTPREHEGACGSCQQSHEDGRLEDLPHIYHQWEDEQQGLGPVSWDSESARDAGQVRGKKKKRPRSIHLYPSFFLIEVLNFILSLVSVRQENPGRVTENLSFHIQQCVWLHQVSAAACHQPKGFNLGLIYVRITYIGNFRFKLDGVKFYTV